MNASKFQDIVARAMTDEEFLGELLKDPVKATAVYDLSKEEVEALNAIDQESLAQIGDELGERISKGYLDLQVMDMLATHSSHHSSHSKDVALQDNPY